MNRTRKDLSLPVDWGHCVQGKFNSRVPVPTKETCDISRLPFHWYPLPTQTVKAGWPSPALSPQWAINKRCWLKDCCSLDPTPQAWTQKPHLPNHLGGPAILKVLQIFLIQWVSGWSREWWWVHFQNSQSPTLLHLPGHVSLCSECSHLVVHLIYIEDSAPLS